MTGNGSYVNLLSFSKLVFSADFSSAVWVVYIQLFDEIFFCLLIFTKTLPWTGMEHDICTPCFGFSNLLSRFLRGFAKVEGQRRGPGSRQQLERDHQDHPGGQRRGRLDIRGRCGVKRGPISCQDPVC